MRLRYTREAIAELAQVLERIAEHSPRGARRVRSRFRTEKELVVVSIRHAARSPTTMPDAP